MMLGIMMSAMVLAVFAVLDDTIHDEDYILHNYEYPILGKVPDLNDSGKEKYASYYSLSNKKDDVEKER